MNDLINWIATHDTLLIRIGFTAILVLVVVYIYRFFFVPKINIVAEASPASNAADKPVTTEAGKPTEEKTTSSQPSFDLSVVAKKTEEIESLKLEVSKLQTQVSDSEKIIAELKEKAQAANTQASSTSEAGAVDGNTLDSGSIASNQASADPNVVAELNSKIEQLQNRLAEYEIIAEDISEISQLRQENAELKKKLAASPNVETDTSIISQAQAELKTEVSESPGEAENQNNSVTEPSAESIKLVSEKEVSTQEKELINQFEEVLTKKGS